MFFKMSKLKKLLKNAYKVGSLTVGHMEESEGTEEGIYLSSGWWILWFLWDTMEKEVKAAIIELCGDLPAPGQVFKAYKDGNQYEIEQNELFNLPALFERSNEKYRITEVILETGQYNVRILQNLSGETRWMQESIIEMLDNKSLREDERVPKGPVSRIGEEIILWGNGDGYLAVFPVSKDQNNDEHAQCYKNLEGVILP